MIIKSIHVKNLRGVVEASLQCDMLTALVGGNGCGKSTFLKAMELFYAPSPRVTISDFYNDDPSDPVEVTVTFTSLGERAKQRFASYIQDDELSVSRLVSLHDGKQSVKYYGMRLQVRAFAPIRESASATETRQRYNDLRSQREFDSLPAASSAAKVLEHLASYEQDHPEECEWIRDEGQFFGFTAVGQGYLGDFTRFLLIPAVRDAGEDGLEGRGSPITELLDLSVRGALASRKDLQDLRESVTETYRQLMDPTSLPELAGLQDGLMSTLRAYVPDAGIHMQWRDVGEIQLPMPQAEVKLIEHGYRTEIKNAGHGLQRTFVLTMLHSLALAKSSKPSSPEAPDESPDEGRELPNFVLAIEEPELYQHPNRQRHFSRLLYNLANDPIPGVSHKTQVIYSTHSPHFIGIDRFHQVRVCHKVDTNSDLPRVTRVVQVMGDDVAAELGNVKPGSGGKQEHSWDKIHASLHRIMTPLMNEGFFAEVVVLVEGDEDRAAILGVAYTLGIDLEGIGVSVISCGGKSTIFAPLVIFRQFGIRTYIVWDGDDGNPHEKSKNRQLLQLLGSTPEDFPDTYIGPRYACFKGKIADILRDDLGGTFFDDTLSDCIDDLGIRGKANPDKNPIALMQCIEEAYRQGRRCKTLERVVQQIMLRKLAGVTPHPTRIRAAHAGTSGL